MTELIVLLGEGNYSFAIEFVRMLRSGKSLNSRYEVLASDFKVGDHCGGYKGNDPKTRENIRKLILDYGVRIWTDLDATHLQHHPRLIADLKSAAGLKRVHFIFNFPHVQTSKMRIDLNRALLKETFIAIEDLSRDCSVDVKVYISLCYGQSGINAVEPKHKHRSWNDSWQLTEMASYGNFILVDVCPFSPNSFKKLFCDNVAREQSVYESNFVFQKGDKDSLLNLNESDEVFKNYDPFGYKNQSKPFGMSNKKRFEGGNIFVFEHREFKLDCFIPRIIFTHPLSSNLLVQQFIDDIREIMLVNIDGCGSVKPYLVEKQCILGDHCDTPMDVFLLCIDLVDSETHCTQLGQTIGRYLNESFVEDLLTDDLRINDINFGFWSKDEHSQKLLSLNLLVENCLRIKWKITNVRMLYSRYFHLMKNPSQIDQQISTTGSLYPQTYYRDIAFWWQGPQLFPQDQFFRMVWDHFQPTNLCSVQLREKYIKSMEPLMVSYCFRLVIQSVDLALNTHKVHELMVTLGIRMTEQFSQIKIR